MTAESLQLNEINENNIIKDEVNKVKRSEAMKLAQKRYYEKIKSDPEKYELLIECQREHNRKYRENNRKKYNEYQKEYQRTQGKEWKNEYMKECYKKEKKSLNEYHKKKDEDPEFLKKMAKKKREYRMRKKLEKQI